MNVVSHIHFLYFGRALGHCECFRRLYTLGGRSGLSWSMNTGNARPASSNRWMAQTAKGLVIVG